PEALGSSGTSTGSSGAAAAVASIGHTTSDAPRLAVPATASAIMVPATATREIGTAALTAEAAPGRAWVQQMLVANLTERATQVPLAATRPASSGEDETLPQDVAPASWKVNLADALTDRSAKVNVRVSAEQFARDACFADCGRTGERLDLEAAVSADAGRHAGPATGVAAAAALAFVLGGYGRGAHAEADPRSRKRFLR